MTVPGKPEFDEHVHPSTSKTPVSDALRGKRLLLVASTGGHLAQLDKISRLLQFDESSIWVTFEKPQSTSMLSGRIHHFIPYIAPRDLVTVVRQWSFFRKLIRESQVDAVLSTGAAIALASHLPALASRTPAFYIESVSRFDGPSLTGRVMGLLPVRRLTQHRSWSSARWPYELSVMDAYSSTYVATSTPLKRVFVTLGTIHPYRFDSLVDAVARALPHDVEVVWQLGSTSRTDLRGKVVDEMSAAEFEQNTREADLVVTHAGVGTIMQLLDEGVPVLAVPRRQSRSEHVDDHQQQICTELARRGLATVSEATDIDEGLLHEARRLRPGRLDLGAGFNV